MSLELNFCDRRGIQLYSYTVYAHSILYVMCSFKLWIFFEYAEATLCLQKDISSLVATLDALKDSYGGNVSEFLNLHNEAGADQKEAAELMDKLKNVQKVKQ